MLINMMINIRSLVSNDQLPEEAAVGLASSFWAEVAQHGWNATSPQYLEG